MADIDLTGQGGGNDGDDHLVSELRAVANAVDAVPEPVVAAARASLTWRTIDAELAELAYDSLLDDAALAGTRAGGDTGPRLLTFEAADMSVEVEVTEVGARRKLVGQLVPPAPATVEVRHPGGTSTVAADGLGRFSVDAVDAGPVSLRITVTGPVTTAWVVL